MEPSTYSMWEKALGTDQPSEVSCLAASLTSTSARWSLFSRQQSGLNAGGSKLSGDHHLRLKVSHYKDSSGPITTQIFFLAVPSPPLHTTQSQGPLPFCFSLWLLPSKAFSLVILGLECSLSLSAGAKSLTSFRTWCKWNLLGKAYPEHPTPQWALTCPSHRLALPPLLIPLLGSSFPIALGLTY